MSGYVWRHQLDRIIIALFVLGKTYVVEPIFLLNLYWQKKCTLTVLEWSHFCLHCLEKIIHISRLGNEKSWRNLDIKVWYIFVGLLLNFNSYHIFHAISLEQTWKLLETCISTLEKDCEFFIIALYYKSTHLQNSGRDHVQWHKPLGSTLIWLANIIVHCQSCQRRSQDSFV